MGNPLAQGKDQIQIPAVVPRVWNICVSAAALIGSKSYIQSFPGQESVCKDAKGLLSGPSSTNVELVPSCLKKRLLGCFDAIQRRTFYGMMVVIL